MNVDTRLDAADEARLIKAVETVCLVACAHGEIAQLLRPVWAKEVAPRDDADPRIPESLNQGGPVRSTRTHNEAHGSGLLYSPKNGGLRGWESQLEKKAMTLLECDPDVVRYWAQPMTLRYELDGKQTHYTPDLFIWRRSTRCVAEVKPCRAASKDKNRRRFALFECFFRRFGISFRVLDETVVALEPRQRNCRFLLRYHDEALSDEDVAALRQRLCHGAATATDLAGHLTGPRPLDRVYASILRGYVRADHRIRISEHSILQAI